MFISATMVQTLCSPVVKSVHRRGRVARMTVIVAFAFGAFFAGTALCQDSRAHFYHQGVMPPGAIGSVRLARGGPLRGYFQPVEIKVPKGILISMAEGGTFEEPKAASPKVGLLIGAVYRMRVINIPFLEGVEVFPTLEVIDRTYPPKGQELQFPIVVEVTEADLRLAAAGKFVTRVIYLEDPKSVQASNDSQPNEQSWFDVAPHQDPLIEADKLGRPVAILRMGGRVPMQTGQPSVQFLFGCPPLQRFVAAKVAPVVAPQPVIKDQARRPERVRVLSRPPEVRR